MTRVRVYPTKECHIMHGTLVDPSTVEVISTSSWVDDFGKNYVTTVKVGKRRMYSTPTSLRRGGLDPKVV